MLVQRYFQLLNPDNTLQIFWWGSFAALGQNQNRWTTKDTKYHEGPR